jgi:O-antigen ligase
MFGYGVLGMVPERYARAAQIFAALFALIMVFFYLGFSSLITSEHDVRSLTDLNGRGAAWKGVRYLVVRQPWIGWGWIEGPAKIGDHTGQGWWHARNAQNDVLNFTVANGLVAGACAALMYAWMVLVGVSTMFDRRTRLLFGTAITVFVSSLVEPIASNLATTVGLSFIMLVLVVSKTTPFRRHDRAAPATRRRTAPSRVPALR